MHSVSVDCMNWQITSKYNDMTVGELKKALKGYKDTSEVFLVKDWEACNENGELIALASLRTVTDQRVVIDMGLDFEDQTQVLLEFEEE